jgi:hypothetical protein
MFGFFPQDNFQAGGNGGGYGSILTDGAADWRSVQEEEVKAVVWTESTYSYSGTCAYTGVL